jgi:hypothetical protein
VYVPNDFVYVPNDFVYVPNDFVYVPNDFVYVPNDLCIKQTRILKENNVINASRVFTELTDKPEDLMRIN